MDYTIDVWTIQGTHYASCDCEWRQVSPYQPVIEALARNHKKLHDDQGDAAEIV